MFFNLSVLYHFQISLVKRGKFIATDLPSNFVSPDLILRKEIPNSKMNSCPRVRQARAMSLIKRVALIKGFVVKTKSVSCRLFQYVLHNTRRHPPDSFINLKYTWCTSHLMIELNQFLMHFKFFHLLEDVIEASPETRSGKDDSQDQTNQGMLATNTLSH